MLDRDRIVEATDLAALADELLGPRRGTTRSGTWPCPSPNHAQTGRTPPVSIYRAGSGEERWHCHGCGIGGSAIDLVMAARGVAVRDALDELAARVGIREPLAADHVLRRPPAPRPATAAGEERGDPEGLAAFVDRCAKRLWCPEGRVVLRWLTEARGLPEDVLQANRIGADPGRGGQERPDGMPAAGWAAVLPVHDDGRAVFAQLRSIRPLPGRPRYLHAAGRVAPNPRVGMYEPADPVGQCVIVTEGVLDALSANAAGFRAAAVLGAALAGVGSGHGGDAVADRLVQRRAPLVVAFDADDAGERAGKLLAALVRERGTRVTRLHVPRVANDLNTWMRRSPEWQQTFRSAVRTAVIASSPPRSLSR